MTALALLRSVAVASLVAAAGLATAQESVTLTRADRQPVPVTVHAAAVTPCRGIALVSPGAGGTEQGLGYLGHALSAAGYLAVVVGHAESGPRALREHARGRSGGEAVAALVTDAAAYRARFQDLAAARAWAAPRCPSPTAVLVGHSMGAATTLIEAGARNRLGLPGGPGFDAYVALSPQGAGAIFPPDAWSGIRRPVLTITGTRDAALDGSSWRTRTEPHAGLPPGCKWLGVVDGATHLALGGVGASRRTEALVTQVVVAFLDGVHRGDCGSPPTLTGVDLQTK